MTHLDDGRLRAYLDGELGPAEAADAEEWIAQDDDARLKIEQMRQRDEHISTLLGELDEAPPTDRVRQAIEEARMTSRGGAEPSVRSTPLVRWAQAAALVLLGAGAASAALPGSPVRAWLTERSTDGEVQQGPVDPREQGVATRMTGARVAAANGQVRLEVTGLPIGAEIEVLLVPGDTAGLYAPVQGSSFETFTAFGRIRVSVSSGPVRVEIPRDIGSASLSVNGRMYLTKEGDRLELPGPVVEQAETTIRFESTR